MLKCGHSIQQKKHSHVSQKTSSQKDNGYRIAMQPVRHSLPDMKQLYCISKGVQRKCNWYQEPRKKK